MSLTPAIEALCARYAWDYEETGGGMDSLARQFGPSISARITRADDPTAPESVDDDVVITFTLQTVELSFLCQTTDEAMKIGERIIQPR